MKTYTFRFNAQLAEFHGNGIVGVIYGGKETHLKEEVKEMTWPEAQAYLPKFAEEAPAPSACFLSCIKADRLPPGYKKANRVIYKQQ